jgi:hypothetical protein
MNVREIISITPSNSYILKDTIGSLEKNKNEKIENPYIDRIRFEYLLILLK